MRSLEEDFDEYNYAYEKQHPNIAAEYKLEYWAYHYIKDLEKLEIDNGIKITAKIYAFEKMVNHLRNKHIDWYQYEGKASGLHIFEIEKFLDELWEVLTPEQEKRNVINQSDTAEYTKNQGIVSESKEILKTDYTRGYFWHHLYFPENQQKHKYQFCNREDDLRQVATKYLQMDYIQTPYLDWLFADAIIGMQLSRIYDKLYNDYSPVDAFFNRRRFKNDLSEWQNFYNQLSGPTIHIPSLKKTIDKLENDGFALTHEFNAIISNVSRKTEISWVPSNLDDYHSVHYKADEYINRRKQNVLKYQSLKLSYEGPETQSWYWFDEGMKNKPTEATAPDKKGDQSYAQKNDNFDNYIILPCNNCGKKNRIARNFDSTKLKPVCAACGADLFL